MKPPEICGMNNKSDKSRVKNNPPVLFLPISNIATILVFSCDSSSIPRFVTDGLTDGLTGTDLGQSYTTQGNPQYYGILWYIKVYTMQQCNNAAMQQCNKISDKR